MIRILIIGGTRIHREGLAQTLGADERFEVVGTVDSVATLHADWESAPDVALLDFAMASSLGAIPRIRDLVPDVGVVVMAVPESEPDILACAAAGASGFVTRDATLQDLSRAIVDVTQDELHCSPRMARALLRLLSRTAPGRLPSQVPGSLTARENEVGGLIALGLSNKEIARRLHLSENTVKQHVHRLLEKLHVRRRGEVALRLRDSDAHSKSLRPSRDSRLDTG